MDSGNLVSFTGAEVVYTSVLCEDECSDPLSEVVSQLALCCSTADLVP